jgi:hypothetical protein
MPHLLDCERVSFGRTSTGTKLSLTTAHLSSILGLVRFALNPCGLDRIRWVLIPNKSKSFTIFSNLIQSTWDRNNRTSPYLYRIVSEIRFFFVSKDQSHPWGVAVCVSASTIPFQSIGLGIGKDLFSHDLGIYIYSFSGRPRNLRFDIQKFKRLKQLVFQPFSCHALLLIKQYRFAKL